MTVPEAARLSRYTAYHIRYLLNSGKLRGEKKGRDWWVDRQDLARYLAEMKKLGTKKHSPTRG
ncbi:MAG TPA: helix-turn-helix domain-containing protein [Anaerolineae bacterium]